MTNAPFAGGSVYRSKAPSLLLLVVLSLCASVDVRLSYEILLAPKCMCKCKHNVRVVTR
jgi:hypothetical protein